MRGKILLSLKRIYLLLRNDLLAIYRKFFIIIGSISVFMIALGLLAGGIDSHVYGIFFLLILFLGGYLFTSFSFMELHSQHMNIYYLTIPASRFEKFIAKLVETTLFYIVFVMIIHFALSVVIYIFSLMKESARAEIFNPFNMYVWLGIAVYVVTQSFFFLGAVYFKKMNFFKTVLFTGIFSIGVTLFTSFCAWLLFRDSIGAVNISMPMLHKYGSFFASITPSEYAVITAVIWSIIAVFFWFVAYIRFVEKEA